MTASYDVTVILPLLDEKDESLLKQLLFKFRKGNTKGQADLEQIFSKAFYLDPMTVIAAKLTYLKTLSAVDI